MSKFDNAEIASFKASSEIDKDELSYESYHMDSSINARSAQRLGQRIRQALGFIPVQQSIGLTWRVSEAAGALSFSLDQGIPVDLGEYTDVLAGRRSRRDYTGDPISANQLCAILGVLIGQSPSRVHRTYPSAGACYPIEVFVNVRNVNQIPPGLYMVNFEQTTLVRVGPLIANVTLDKHEKDAVATAILVMVFARTTYKYGARGYRFGLLEAGAMMQLLEMTAAAVKVGAVSSGGYLDEEILKACGLTFPDVGVVAAIHFGSVEHSK